MYNEITGHKRSIIYIGYILYKHILGCRLLNLTQLYSITYRKA